MVEQVVDRHLALVGPTASGKSALAMELARRLPGIELVSVDSMQVYRGMDIGTAKPSKAEQAEVPHHLLDLVDPSDDFTLTQFQTVARAAIRDIEDRGKTALLVGGTGLYLRSILDDLDIPGQYPEVRKELDSMTTETLHKRLQASDPGAAAKADKGNRRRILRALEVTIGSGRPFSSFGPGIDAYPPSRFRQLGIWLPRSVGRERIERRVNAMLNQGWVDEVHKLAAQGEFSRTATQALGYRELLMHLDGLDINTAAGDVTRRTRSFARRQRMWFRRDPRIAWYGTPAAPASLLPALLGHCEARLAGAPVPSAPVHRLRGKKGGDSRP